MSKHQNDVEYFFVKEINYNNKGTKFETVTILDEKGEKIYHGKVPHNFKLKKGDEIQKYKHGKMEKIERRNEHGFFEHVVSST